MGKEKRQLNISAPLLSVRKHLYPRTSAALTVEILTEKKPVGAQFSLLVDKSAGESEQVTKPVAVPFLWEKTPGRPKRDSYYNNDEEPATTPRPPPGRLFEVGTPRTPHGRTGETCYPSRLFLPGKIFGEKSSNTFHPGRLVDGKHVPGKPRTSNLASARKSWVQNNTKCQGEAFTTTGHTSLLERLKESLDSDRESDKSSGDDIFSDALDTLCPNDSLSLDSSVSGLSSSCHQNCGSSGSFAADLQTRAYMMSRFLPQAEAAVVHMPQYAAKNQPVVIRKTVKKAIPLERKPLLKQKGHSARPFSNQHMEYQETEDEDVEYDDPKIRMGKTCGIFQRLCASVSHSKRKSWRKLKTLSSKPSSGEVKELTRNSYRGPVDKSNDAVSKILYPSEITSQDLRTDRNKFTGEPKQISFSSNIYSMEDKRSPTTCSRSGALSSVRRERSPSLLCKDATFRGLPKPMEPKTDEISLPAKGDKPEVLSQRSNKKEFAPRVVVKEKTMLADILRKKVTDMNLDSSKAERPSNSRKKKLETMAGREAVCNFGSAGVVSTSTCNSKFPGISPISEKHNQEDNFLGTEGYNLGKIMVNDQEESNWAPLLHPSSPLSLPKSPSESWLGHTLQSISLRDSFSRLKGRSHSQYVSKKKQPSTGLKWEKFRKSSKIHHDCLRYSEVTE